jgi:glycosyltransferase involved in cell wall biosynthesis
LNSGYARCIPTEIATKAIRLEPNELLNYLTENHFEILVTWGTHHVHNLLDGWNGIIIQAVHGEYTEFTTSLVVTNDTYIDHYLAVSQSAKAGLLTCEIDPSRITLIHNGIDPSRLLTSPYYDRATYRRDKGVKDTDTLITYVGRLSPEKRVDRLIKAIKLLPVNYRALIVGNCNDPSQTKKYHQLAKGFEDRIIFQPFTWSVGDVYAAADVFYGCSEYEAFWYSAVEAAAAGVPLVINTRGVFEEFENKNYWVELGHDASPEDIARTILNSKLEPSVELQDYVLNNFTIEKMVGQLDGLISGVSKVAPVPVDDHGGWVTALDSGSDYSFVGGALTSGFCVSNTVAPEFDGFYVSAGTFNNASYYYCADTDSYLFNMVSNFSGWQWTLAAVLGDITNEYYQAAKKGLMEPSPSVAGPYYPYNGASGTGAVQTCATGNLKFFGAFQLYQAGLTNPWKVLVVEAADATPLSQDVAGEYFYAGSSAGSPYWMFVNSQGQIWYLNKQYSGSTWLLSRNLGFPSPTFSWYSLNTTKLEPTGNYVGYNGATGTPLVSVQVPGSTVELVTSGACIVYQASGSIRFSGYIRLMVGYGVLTFASTRTKVGVRLRGSGLITYSGALTDWKRGYKFRATGGREIFGDSAYCVLEVYWYFGPTAGKLRFRGGALGFSDFVYSGVGSIQLFGTAAVRPMIRGEGGITFTGGIGNMFSGSGVLTFGGTGLDAYPVYNWVGDGASIFGNGHLFRVGFEFANVPTKPVLVSWGTGTPNITVEDELGNVLPFEVDSFNTLGDDYVYVWVLPSTTVVWLYWGGPAGVSQSSPWVGYEAVYHFQDYGVSATGYEDATAYNAVPVGAVLGLGTDLRDAGYYRVEG